MPKTQSALVKFFITVLAILALTLLAPEERSLGANVRLVYLHGAWVLTAQLAFIVSGLVGLAGLIFKRRQLQQWSAALGRTGLAYWLTYIPLSLWAMQANWNGLFLSEPRFRLAITFAIAGLLLQAGLWILGRDWLTSALNSVYITGLILALRNARYVMHPPPSPIFNSNLWMVILFFSVMNILAWLAAYWLARWFLTIARTD